MVFDAIVSAYERDYQKQARAEERFYATRRTLQDAIHYAARCLLPRSGRPGYRRHPHQCRIPGPVLERAEALLLEAQDRLRGAPDFDSLHCIVTELIGSLRGIGALTVYDIAHRIGGFLNKSPAFVYLHAGTLEGARKLGIAGERVTMEQLPVAFRRLRAAEVEDCLCLYKDRLARDSVVGSGPGSRCLPS
jgi:hypothetical protein